MTGEQGDRQQMRGGESPRAETGYQEASEIERATRLSAARSRCELCTASLQISSSIPCTDNRQLPESNWTGQYNSTHDRPFTGVGNEEAPRAFAMAHEE